MNFFYGQVAFINPPAPKSVKKLIRTFDCNTESKGNYLYQPYDYVVLSGAIPKNIDIEFVDACAHDLDGLELFSRNEKNKFDIIFISIGQNVFQNDLEYLKKVRQLNEETPIIVFGAPFVEQYYRDIVSPIVDGILHNPLSLDLDLIERRNDQNLIVGRGFVSDDQIYKSPQRKAPVKIELDTPRHELFLDRKYRWPFAQSFLYTSVFLAWGCPYSCSYCILNSFPFIYRGHESVLKELSHIKEMGLKEIYFADRSFGLPRNETVQLLEGMIEKNYGFTWSSYFHPNQYDEQLLELMAKSGCHTIIVGIESSDFKSLKEFGRHQKKDKLQGLLRDCKKYGIKICGDFIIGLPGEDEVQIRETISYSKKIGLSYASYNIAAPLPGSIIRKNALEQGVDNSEISLMDSMGNHGVLASGSLNAHDLIKLRNYAVLSFYLRPFYLMKRVITLKSFSQFVIQFQEMVSIIKNTVGKS